MPAEFFFLLDTLQFIIVPSAIVRVLAFILAIISGLFASAVAPADPAKPGPSRLGYSAQLHRSALLSTQS